MIRLIFVFLLSFICTIPLFFYFVLVSFATTSDRKLHSIASLWSRLILIFSGTQVECIGFDKISPSEQYLIVSNHQSSYDIFTLLAYFPTPFSFISRPLYFYLPIIGQSMKRMHFIPIDRKKPREAIHSLNRAAKLLENKKSVLIFPEGTRSIDGAVHPFKLGALQIGFINQKTNILPLAITGTYSIQPKGSFKIKKANVKLIVGTPIVLTKENLTGKGNKIKWLQKLQKKIEIMYETHKTV